jgi:hypothetical protein
MTTTIMAMCRHTTIIEQGRGVLDKAATVVRYAVVTLP